MAFNFVKEVVAEALKPESTLIGLLRQNLAGKEKARSHERTHASDVTKSHYCPREIALLTTTKTTKPDQWVPTALRTTFDMGNMTSDLVREKWLGQAAVGNWKCSTCGKFKTMRTMPTEGCPTPQPCQWKYVEPRFESIKYQISGGIDVLVDLGAPKLFVTELKIMAPDQFEKLVAPLAEHRLRTNLYMNLVDNSNSPYKGGINTSQAKVLYVSRGYGKKNPEANDEIVPFKEFNVARNDEQLKGVLGRAYQVVVWKKEGKMPNGICSTILDSAAKQCSCTKVCFSGKYPHQQESFEL